MSNLEPLSLDQLADVSGGQAKTFWNPHDPHTQLRYPRSWPQPRRFPYPRTFPRVPRWPGIYF